MKVRLFIASTIILVLGLISSAAPASGTTTGFTSVGSMGVDRASFALTLLPSGQVLATGGNAFGDRRAEIYDAASRTFAFTGSMTSGRISHTATLLPDGKVLVAGGTDPSFLATASAEIYDPVSGTFAPTGSMTVPRSGHTATLLPNGKVLVVGGHRFNFPNSALASAELYDPAGGAFTPTGSLPAGRGDHMATLLKSGNVLIVGGFSAFPGGARATAEVYDPNTGTFLPGGMTLTSRGEQSATLLPDGSVLVAGGFTAFPFLGTTLSSSEIYDPDTSVFGPGPEMTGARGRHAAVALANGDVLVAGGFAQCCSALRTAELFVAGDTTPPAL